MQPSAPISPLKRGGGKYMGPSVSADKNGAGALMGAWSGYGSVIRSTHVGARDPFAMERIQQFLGAEPMAAVLLFLSPAADIMGIAGDCVRFFPAVPVIGCTTAGEISSDGYAEGEIVAVGLPARDFAVEPIFIPDLDDLHSDAIIAQMIRARQRLSRLHPHWPGEFCFLMVDGLSLREDALVSALASGLGPVPLFGGSSGDGTRFQQTWIIHQGMVHQNAAVLSFVRTRCHVKVFSIDHLVPQAVKMVVTEADPSQRIVRRINAEPAAFEYARLLGKDPAQLTTFTFAAHPVVVRIGGRHHVRSIQRMMPNGDLVFFSAIDEGVVLTLAEPQNIARHLDSEMQKLSAQQHPAAILACDCLLRRIEAEEKQLLGQVSDVLRRHQIVGFSTYGEQFGALHVNQTMTGVALYPPIKEGG